MEHVIFLSYRRMDTSGHAGRISNDLGRCFGNSVMFRDINSIGPGVDFVQALEQAIQSARVCLVLIGNTWLAETAADGEPRLDSPDDHVRREIEMALNKEGLKVIPLLVEGAHMPDEDDLPVSIRKLARLQAVELSESRWDYDMARLVAVLGASGIGQRFYQRLSRGWRFMLLVVLLTVMVVPVYFWRSALAVDVYSGLWYLPNGGYWSVEEKDARLWVDETHFESHQVWRQGPADIVDGELRVQLALVFKRTEPPFLYRLRLSADRQSLVGSVRRPGRPAGESLVLRRRVP
jgi:hypothetical protein